ncbi:S1C family serine protease [Candidatus Poriferisodalis sp.]|uniref:S1C family serine protease n=1 Tax=Candidatus Poriferisodalis sp. TaxID=3101277 RepID=UPI003C6FB8AD
MEVQRLLAATAGATPNNAGSGTAGSRGCGGSATSGSSDNGTSATLSAAETFAQVSPSIPIVRTCAGHGSGILIEGGYIVTNDHVVWLCSEATVLFPDGTEYTNVPVLATNPWADIAVLGPIQTTKRKLALADGENLPPGSDLYLIGYPAEFEVAPQPSITRGILSRIRQWASYDLTLLQADAAITGGQSGGALIDGRGRVVGVSTWSWTQANFSIATSAADQAEIIELMLDEDDDYGYSVDWASRFGDTGSTQQRFTLPAGLHTQSFWIDHDGDDDVDVRLHGCTDAWLWVTDLFGTYSEVDDEGVLPQSVRLYDDEGRFVAEDDDSGPLNFLGGSLNPEIRFRFPPAAPATST